MQQRCRRSLVWISPLLLMALVGMTTIAPAARAQDFSPSDLTWLQDAACPDGTAVAAFEAPSWLDDLAEPATAAGAEGYGGCSTNPQCKTKGQYCAKPAGDCKGKGKCTERPKICEEIFKPVCGCNDRTYGNACFAAAAGVNVAYDGPCKGKDGAVPKACKTNKDCPLGARDYCAKETGKCDEEGVCAARPSICPDVVAPVCGCDGKTYNNGCLAHRAGVNVKHDGKCEK
ncbi:MAG TPA: Kazal-type serine protease inhibitor domain-containing protein [Thermoanaerobaculia bacterium]